jgi:hypothetical protein
MKCRKFTIIISVLVVVLSLFASCKGNGSGGRELVSMYGLINGSNWRSADPTAVISDSRIKMTGISGNGQAIIITLNAKQVGEYTFTPTNGHYAEFIPNMASGTERFSTLNDESGSGYVRLSSLNTETKTLGGEFAFTAYRNDGGVKNVTEGKFTNVPYTYYDFGDDVYTNVFSYGTGGTIWSAIDIYANKTDTAMVVYGACDRSVSWQSITLRLPTNITTGRHDFGNDISATFQLGFNNFQATEGAVTISEYNTNTKIIKGTFFFNYMNNNNELQSVTDGTFDIKYTDLTVIE